MRFSTLLLPALISGLVACGGSDNDAESSNTQASAYQGIWTSSVNGDTFEIDNGVVRKYQHNSRFCLIEESFDDVGNDDLADNFALEDNNRTLFVVNSDGTADLSAPIVRYTKSRALPAHCERPVATIGDQTYERDPLRDLDIFGQTFSDFYLSFELKDVDWETRYQQALATVNEDTSDEELLDVLVELVTPLNDAHVHINAPQLGTYSADGKPTLIKRLISEYVEANQISEPLMQADYDGINDYIDSQLTLRSEILFSYAEDGTVRTAANDNLIWYRVDDIAYLYIGAMAGFSNQTEEDDNERQLEALEAGLDEVLIDIQDAAGLIIDVRFNNGGHDFLSMAIASRFVGNQSLVFSKHSRDGNSRSELEHVYIEPRGDIQYLGPIALLTSNSTVSAAEVFTLMMRSLPNVTLIGESTQGALSDALEKQLPNGFEFSLSNQFYLSSEDEWFEDTGIPVDINVPFFTQSEREAEIDEGIEAAYVFLTSGN